jgi:DNA-directed RNA polymerase sigma subunit (sigma70/sigma32)
MPKKIEFIPFMGAVEIDDEDEVTNTHPMTHQEIADALGLARGTVGEVEKRAMSKVRKILLSKFKKEDLI